MEADRPLADDHEPKLRTQSPSDGERGPVAAIFVVSCLRAETWSGICTGLPGLLKVLNVLVPDSLVTFCTSKLRTRGGAKTLQHG